jgi:hypothetical protein
MAVAPLSTVSAGALPSTVSVGDLDGQRAKVDALAEQVAFHSGARGTGLGARLVDNDREIGGNLLREQLQGAGTHQVRCVAVDHSPWIAGVERVTRYVQAGASGGGAHGETVTFAARSTVGQLEQVAEPRRLGQVEHVLCLIPQLTAGAAAAGTALLPYLLLRFGELHIRVPQKDQPQHRDGVFRRRDKEYFFACPDDYAQSGVEWVRNSLSTRARHPAFEIIFVYCQSEGPLDIYAPRNSK